MACTCKSWNTFGEPVFSSLRGLAFEYYKGTPKSDPDTIFKPEQARNFALACLVSRISNHAMEELPEHVIMLGCSFSNMLSKLAPNHRKDSVVRYLSSLRGLTEDRWGKLMNLLDDANDKVLLRLAAISSPQAALMFAHPLVLQQERKQNASDLTDQHRNSALESLANRAHCWAKDHGAKGLPEALFHALPVANFSFYWAACRLSFSVETILSLLKQPLPDYRREVLMDTLLGPVFDRLPNVVRDLPPGSETEILGLVSDWLAKLPPESDATVLKYLANRIEIKKFDPSKAQDKFNGVVIRACARKKHKCPHAAVFLETVLKRGILTQEELKGAKELAKLLQF